MTTRRALLGVAVPSLAAAAAGLAATPARAATTTPLPPPDPLARAVRAISTQDFAPARIVVLGSSTTEGQGATRLDRRYVRVLESLLRRRPGGMFRPAGRSYPCQDDPVRLSEGAVNAHSRPALSIGWAGRSVALTSRTSLVEFDFAGTSVQVVYGRYPGGPELTFTVDGFAQTVATDGPLDRWVTWTSPNLPAGPHTVRVHSSGTADGFLRGFRSFNGDERNGVHVYEGGRSGWTTADYLAAEPQWGDGIAAIGPDLLVLQLGANDVSASRAPEAMRDDIVAIVRKAQARQPENPASVIVVGSAQTTGSLPTETFRQLYVAMWQQAAEQVGGVFLDPSDVLPSPGTTGSLYGSDNVHLRDEGHAALGYLIARMLPMLPPAY